MNTKQLWAEVVRLKSENEELVDKIMRGKSLIAKSSNELDSYKIELKGANEKFNSLVSNHDRLVDKINSIQSKWYYKLFKNF